MKNKHLTLGELISKLEPIEKSQNLYLVLTDGRIKVPGELDSYRGYYKDLAIGFKGKNFKRVSVGDFVEKLKAAIGTVYTGYKGGDYKMDQDTYIWVANWGECGGDNAVVEISRDAEGNVYIITEVSE